MVVDDGSHAILGYRVYGRYTILDTCQTVALRTYPDTTVRSIAHTRHFETGQLSVETYHTLVAGSIPYRSVGMLCHSCHIAHQVRSESVDVLTRKGHTRLLSTYPQQSSIVHIQTLYADVISDKLFLVDVAWLNRLYLVSCRIHSEQSQLVATYPDAAGVFQPCR